MPQLDPSSFLSQLFWLFITFVFLYVILSRFALPGIRDIIQAREDKIESDIQKAENAKNEAQEVEKAYLNELKEAKQKASFMINEANNIIKKELDIKYKELEKAINSEILEAKLKIDKIAAESENELRIVAKNLTQNIIYKFTSKTIDDNVAKKLLNFID